MVSPKASAHCELSFLGLLNCRSAVALQNRGQTVGALAAVLSTSAAAFGVQLIIFSVLRRRLPDLYEPKAFRRVERSHLTSRCFFGWIRASTTARSETQYGDAYFFLRYLRMLLTIFSPAAILIVPILVPLNSTSGNQQSGLDRLSISNISPENNNRLWAHVAVATAFVSWTIYIASCELDHYVRKRQDAKRLAHDNQSVSATTCFVSNIPKDLLSTEALRRLCTSFPGGVRHVWINRDLGELLKRVDQRMEVVQALEQAETRLIRLCYKKHSQKPRTAKDVCKVRFSDDPNSCKNAAKWSTKDRRIGDRGDGQSNAYRSLNGHETDGSTSMRYPSMHQPVQANISKPDCSRPENMAASMEMEIQYQRPLWRQYLDDCERETVRTSLIGSRWMPSLRMFGQKIDKIEHLREQLVQLSSEIEELQRAADEAACMNSAFIQFERVEAAQMFCQSVLSPQPQQMTPRLSDIDPGDLCRENLSLSWREQLIRQGAVFLLCAALVPLYAVPIAFSSLMNKIVWLADKAAWLEWLNHAPEWILVALQGILPPLMLGVILALVPMIFRFLVRRLRLLTTSAEEVGVQRWYFSFLFVQIFLVVSVSGGVTESLADLATDPSGLVRSLATNLPKASNYFLSYITVQALSRTTSILLRYPNLLVWAVTGQLTDTTPRTKARQQKDLCTIQWGTQYPPITNIASIAIIYAITSPIVALFVVPTIYLFWIAYRYNIIYVYDNQIDGGGRSFPVAINQLFTGLYFMELCLTAFLFALASGGRLRCLPQALIMCFVLVGTVVSQVLLIRMYGPLLHYLPVQTSTGLRYDGETKPGPRTDTSHKGIESSNSSKHTWRYLQTMLRFVSSVVDDVVKPTLSHERHHHCSHDDSLPICLCIDKHDRGDPPYQHMTFRDYALHLTPPTVWLPRDSLGISTDEIRYMRAANIGQQDGEWNQQDFSDIGARIDTDGSITLIQDVAL